MLQLVCCVEVLLCGCVVVVLWLCVCVVAWLWGYVCVFGFSLRGTWRRSCPQVCVSVCNGARVDPWPLNNYITRDNMRHSLNEVARARVPTYV